MRSIQLVLLATLVLGSREAAAEPLELAGGTLTLGIGTLTLLTLPVASASVMVSSSGGFTLPAGLVVETGVTLPSSLFTGVSGLSGIRVTDLSNGPLSFDGESGFGVGPLAGRMLVNVLQISSLTLPLSVVGSPGASHHTSGFVVDFFGQGWTSGTASVTGLPTGSPYFLSPTVVFHGNDARSPGHAGDLVLVSPFKMVTNLIGGTTAGFAILELQFAPEPRSVAWLGTALALVAWVARLRKRRGPQAASSPNCSS